VLLAGGSAHVVTHGHLLLLLLLLLLCLTLQRAVPAAAAADVRQHLPLLMPHPLDAALQTAIQQHHQQLPRQTPCLQTLPQQQDLQSKAVL
jgi:hypothetical protein